MTYTREALNGLSRDELTYFALSQQSIIEQRYTDNMNAGTINADTLFTWLWSIKKGSFVIATKKDIMENFNCKASEYSKYMRQLYNDGRLSESKYQGKKVVSSHNIQEL